MPNPNAEEPYKDMGGVKKRIQNPTHILDVTNASNEAIQTTAAIYVVILIELKQVDTNNRLYHRESE